MPDYPRRLVVYRPGEAEALGEMSTGLRQSFIGKGWQLQAADEPAGAPPLTPGG